MASKQKGERHASDLCLGPLTALQSPNNSCFMLKSKNPSSAREEKRHSMGGNPKQNWGRHIKLSQNKSSINVPCGHGNHTLTTQNSPFSFCTQPTKAVPCSLNKTVIHFVSNQCTLFSWKEIKSQRRLCQTANRQEIQKNVLNLWFTHLISLKAPLKQRLLLFNG